jgi:general stress protein YciG
VAELPQKVRKGHAMARQDGQKSNRGFASMDPAKQRAIASKGGKSVPPEKRSFSQDHSLAAEAGRKGGESVPPEERSFSQNRALAAEAGRKGGQSRGANAQAQANRNDSMPHSDQSESDESGDFETPLRSSHEQTRDGAHQR